MPDPAPKIAAPRVAGFTLLELLVVVGIMSLLMAMLLPGLGAARERAQVVKAHAELRGIGLALEMYAMQQGGKYPPVRVNCNTDLHEHWCQLPVELADGGYVPRGPDGGLAACIEDEFNPGHSYKYAAPGPGLINGDPGYDHEMWVPDDFPECRSAEGRCYSDVRTAPVAWAVWTLGPRPGRVKSQSPYAPLKGSTWYTHTRDTGVVVHFADRKGSYFQSP
jgi:prepilin-type N-terminal cleavage/methylation domain-containing protein